MAELDPSTPQLKAIKKLIDAYCSLNVNNVEPLLSKNYEYEVIPKNADFPTHRGEDHLKEYWGRILSLLTKHEVNIHEIIEAPGKVVGHVTLVSSTIFGTTFNYETTYTITYVEEDGELKVLHCKDFGNSQQLSALVAGTLKAAAERVAA